MTCRTPRCSQEPTRTEPFCLRCLGKLGTPNKLRLAAAINALRMTGSPEAQAHYTTVLRECVAHLQEAQ